MPIPAAKLFRLLLLAALLAGLFWALRGPPGEGDVPTEVVITEADVAHLGARWMRQWNRPPTGEELSRAIDAYVRDEVLYREALARGMDRRDPTVRLALIQKMQLLAAGRADAQVVKEEDLASFFALRKEQYRVPTKLSMAQVYFREEGASGEAEKRAAKTLARFRAGEPGGGDVAASGDPIMLQPLYREITATDLERLFGSEFTAAAVSLPVGEWSGPVRSGYGLHLVKILERTPGRIPELEEVRGRVEDDLAYENRKAAEEQGYQEIAGKYRVVMTDEARLALGGVDAGP